MRKFILSCLALMTAGFMMLGAQAASADGASPVSITGSYVVLKMDMRPAGQQLLGANRLSIRNESGHALTSLSVTLNSGLGIDKVLDASKHPLKVHSEAAKLQGAPEVQVTEATITLAAALKPGETTDLNIYYRGRFAPQYAGGIYGVGEPRSDFSLIHYWNFAYPVPASARVSALKALYAASHYKADMQLEFPADLKVASNLQVLDEKDAGARKTVRLHGSRDLPPPLVAVGTYETADFPGVKAFYLDGNGDAAEQLGIQLTEISKTLGRWLGAAPKDGSITIIDLPAGNGHAAGPGMLALPLTDTPSDAELADLRQDLVQQWMPDAPAGSDGSWRAGLMALASDLAAGKDMDTIKAKAFTDAKADTSGDTAGDSFPGATAKLMFCLLDDLAGNDGFRGLIGALRQTFTGIETKNSELAPYLVAHAPNRKVKKLVEHWMQDGKAPKDLGRAADYRTLVKKVS